MIDRQSMENMFRDMRERAKWNIDGVCLWGYFFTDTNREKLLLAANALEQMGYRFVDILQAGPDDDDLKTLFLHVERKEHHTVDSLDLRNRELVDFAGRHGLTCYDGMDVGPITSNA